jgi:phage protein D
MSVTATVAELRTGQNHGDYQFLQLPLAGDQILLATGWGGRDVVEVAYVEHRPIMREPDTTNDRVAAGGVPGATVFVKHLRPSA